MGTTPSPREHIPCSALVGRAPPALPGGARMVVWTIVNVRDWSIERLYQQIGTTPGALFSTGAPILDRYVTRPATQLPSK
jgi:hypothetical protein